MDFYITTIADHTLGYNVWYVAGLVVTAAVTGFGKLWKKIEDNQRRADHVQALRDANLRATQVQEEAERVALYGKLEACEGRHETATDDLLTVSLELANLRGRVEVLDSHMPQVLEVVQGVTRLLDANARKQQHDDDS